MVDFKMIEQNKDNYVKKDIKRYEWLDIIKAICIITVVIFHIGYNSTLTEANSIFKYFGSLAGLFEVTIFYCVAGITLNNDKLKDTFRFLFHKFKKLYLKVITIGICAVLLHNVFIRIGFYKIGFLYSGKIMTAYGAKDYLINIIKTLLLANREVILGAFWFVYSLIICFIILSFIEFIINKLKFIKYKRECRLFTTFLLMFSSIFVSNVFSITIPRFSNSLVGLFLLDFTNYIFMNKKPEKCNIYLLCACLINFLLAPVFGGIAMNSNKITSPYFLIVVVMSILYLLIFVSRKLEKIKALNFLKYIGKNSFSIMAFHFIGFKIGGILLNLIGIETDISLLMPDAYNILYLCYYLVFGISISLLVSYFLKKVLKFEL